MDYSTPLEGRVRTVERSDGTKLYTVSLGGDGRTILLAHAYGFSADEWNLVGTALAERGFRVIAFDQRGHGRSTIGADGIGTEQMASDYGAILETYDATDAVLVGHSMGGFLATAFLVERTEGADRVGGLVLMATFAGDINRKNPQNRLQIPLIKSGILVGLLRFGPIATLFARSLTGEGYQAAYADAFIDVFRSHDHRSLVPILEAFDEESRYDRLGEITIPTTIIVGTKDATTPPFHTADLHAGIAGSRLVEIPGKGHLPNWEAPDVIVEEVAQLAG